MIKQHVFSPNMKKVVIKTNDVVHLRLESFLMIY